MNLFITGVMSSIPDNNKFIKKLSLVKNVNENTRETLNINLNNYKTTQHIIKSSFQDGVHFTVQIDEIPLNSNDLNNCSNIYINGFKLDGICDKQTIRIHEAFLFEKENQRHKIRVNYNVKFRENYTMRDFYFTNAKLALAGKEQSFNLMVDSNVKNPKYSLQCLIEEMRWEANDMKENLTVELVNEIANEKSHSWKKRYGIIIVPTMDTIELTKKDLDMNVCENFEK